MTSMTVIHPDSSILEASRLMRECGVQQLAVVGEADGNACPLGVVTAHDIVTRVLGVGLDPAVLTAGDLVSFADMH